MEPRLTGRATSGLTTAGGRATVEAETTGAGHGSTRHRAGPWGHWTCSYYRWTASFMSRGIDWTGGAQVQHWRAWSQRERLSGRGDYRPSPSEPLAHLPSAQTEGGVGGEVRTDAPV